MHHWCQRLLICQWLLLLAAAYIPASSTNSTKGNISGGPNVTDISQLQVQWFQNGNYSHSVSYQLAGNGSNGLSRGVLVHFSEEKVNETTPPTETPWIAMVACDANATDASQEIDIFTLARDKGAKAALLYSLYSKACIINAEYADPSTFDQVMDIFSTQSLTSAHLIEDTFSKTGGNGSKYIWYDSTLMNDSAAVVNASIRARAPVASGYLLASLQAYNATADMDDPPPGDGAVGASSNDTGGSTNTGLAMIILYAITGCVSALFCVVIISGAIRAIRHPERYGPRAARGMVGGYSSRARGLTRAILDTFPVVKFGTNASDTAPQSPHRTGSIDKDVEAAMDMPPRGAPTTLELRPIDGDSHKDFTSQSDKTDAETDSPASPMPTGQRYEPATPVASPSPSVAQTEAPATAASTSAPHVVFDDVAPAGSSRPKRSIQRDDVVPEAIGRETCPICIVDFEEGDDLRVLPCEGKHRFHQQCVDPWLLELSSSCPICRQDFHALETMLSGESEEDMPHTPSGERHRHSGVQRFSRYLRFARRRRHEQDDYDPTDPYLPTAPVTSMYHQHS
ncbi:hypothetical protein HGRIS_002124 [Hohenbuehelia grisea]|uniref:RING-type domain-containing protein n=1 Tax=Hohenbuehelia grisea TaxID=104357 RepID=A0ABR3JJI9_9AGAR